MLVELFKMSGGNWGIYNIKANKVATVPSSQVQLFQTLKFRLMIAMAFYSLLTVFGNLRMEFRIGATILFYGFITFYYYQRALPSLKWMPYAQLDVPQQQDVTSFFQFEKIVARLGFAIFISILTLLAFQLQPQAADGFSLEQIALILVGISMAIEAFRQGVILLILNKQTQRRG